MKKAKVELVFQVGCIVNSIDETLANLRKYFELEEDSIVVKSTKEKAAQGSVIKNSYNGVPTEFYIKTARLNFGGIDLEYVEPLNKDGGDPYSDWLKEHGQGIHHMNMKLEDRGVLDRIFAEEGRPQHIWSSTDGLELETYDLRDLFGFICEFGDMVVGPRKEEYYKESDR